MYPRFYYCSRPYSYGADIFCFGPHCVSLQRLLSALPAARRREAAYARAAAICDEDVEICRRIGVVSGGAGGDLQKAAAEGALAPKPILPPPDRESPDKEPW